MTRLAKLSSFAPLTLALAALTLVALTGCGKDDMFDGFRARDPVDRPQNLTRDDYRNMNDAKSLLPDGTTGNGTVGAPPIPDVAQVIAAPRPPKVGNTKLVSIAVTDDVPLRDVLFELGRLANVDIEIGPGLENRGVNFRATDKPFNEVIERISDLAGLRYAVKGSALRVELDTPYFKNYPLDFLNIVRSSTNNVNITSNVLSATITGGSSSSSSSTSGSSSSSSGSSSSNGSSSSSALTSGTTSSITSTADSDLWSSLSSSIADILQSTAPVARLGSDAAASAPAASAGENPGAGGSSAGGTNSSGPSNFVINRQAGVLSVNATERQQDKIAMFLAMLERNSSAQVLIEAKIVEVTLNDQFQSGIDWTHIIGGAGKTNVSLGSFQPAAQSSNGFSLDTNGAFAFNLEGGNLDFLLKMTQRFGATRTLSSPRLHAINNQSAVATFVQNRIIQICTPSTTQNSTNSSGSNQTIITTPSFDCPPQALPVGIILNMIPSINLDTQEVTLNVRPTLSRQVDQVDSVANKLAAAQTGTTISSSIPIIEVRELDSVMKVHSGSVMVIGGLMEDTGTSEDRGVPGAASIPWVGNLFKSRDEDSSKRELIIFIKATIVNPTGSASAIDRGVYEKFTTDPRPLF